MVPRADARAGRAGGGENDNQRYEESDEGCFHGILKTQSDARPGTRVRI
jgi:hypothetical protein